MAVLLAIRVESGTAIFVHFMIIAVNCPITPGKGHAASFPG
jgi:hypothetical protein